MCEEEFPLKAVFGILERNGKVYTEVVSDCSRATLQAIIRGHVEIDSIIHSDKWRGYNGLVDMGYPKHYRIDHKDSEFARGRTHINGIEKNNFNLHLKECEFRFSNRNQNIYKLMLDLLSKNPL